MTTPATKTATDTASRKERRAPPLPADRLEQVSGGYVVWFFHH